RIPFEIDPFELSHPEAVEMKNMQRQVALSHALDETGDRGFVIARCKGGREPQAERPRWRQRRPTREHCESAQNVLWLGSIDHEVFETSPSRENWTRVTFSEATSKDTGPVSLTRTP